MRLKRNNYVAMLVTLVLHILIGVILYLTVIRTIVPEELGGIEVMIGNVEQASGPAAPTEQATTPTEVATPPPSPAPPQPEPPALTQEVEESIALPDEKELKAKRKKEEEQRRQQLLAEQKRKEAEAKRIAEEKRRREVSNAVAGAFSQNNGTTNQGSAATGTGAQGSTQGNSNQGANSGIGGLGDFDLGGRGLANGTKLPRPSYSGGAQGTIVVQITVDPAGKVVAATVTPRGTTITNVKMRNEAITAAKRARFQPITDTNNQQGTITYKYQLTQ